MRAGKIAATGIDAWLRGTAIDATVARPVRRAEVITIVVDVKQRTRQRRAAMPEMEVEEALLQYADPALSTQTPAHLDRAISPASARLCGERPGVVVGKE